MTEFGKFWDKYDSELKEHFASRIAFCVWIGKHENELPVQYTLKDVIALRKEIWRRPHGKKTKCEVYSRVVGYIRPVEQWHDGKQAEFTDRKKFMTDDQLEPKQQRLSLGGNNAGRRRS